MGVRQGCLSAQSRGTIFENTLELLHNIQKFLSKTVIEQFSREVH